MNKEPHHDSLSNLDFKDEDAAWDNLNIAYQKKKLPPEIFALCALMIVDRTPSKGRATAIDEQSHVLPLASMQKEPLMTLNTKETDTPMCVFISYAHDLDHPAQADRVLELADRLQDDGLDVVIDQYDPNPKEGWPLWMETNLDDAKFVLLVCTPAYHRRVTRKEKAGVGLGVQWEGNLIYNRLYGNLSQGDRYIPVLLDGGDQANIPTPVQGFTFYRLGTFDLSDPQYEALYRHLTGQHATPKPVLGPRKILPPKARGGTTPPNP